MLSPFSLFLLREKSAKKPTVAGRVANDSEPREVCFNSPSFRGFPSGGGSLRSKVVRGAVIYNTASRATNECEPIAVCFNSPSFRGFPLGGGSLRSKVVRGVVIRIPASRAAQSTDNGLFQFSVFSRLPLGGKLLAKQGGEGRRYPHPGKQSGERMRTGNALFKFSVFSRLPLGGRLLAKQGGEGCRYLQHGKQSGERMRSDSGL